jgi:hypothetical protein
VCLSGSASLLKPSEVLYEKPIDTEVLCGCSDEEWNCIEAWVMISFEGCTVIQEIICLQIQLDSRRGSYNFVFINKMIGT